MTQPIKPGDRRRFKRRYIMYYSRVFDRHTGAVIGYLVDLTAEGAMIVSETPVENGTSYKLRIDMPEDFSPKACLDFEAQVVWVRPEENGKFFNAGLRLLDMPEADQALVERMVQEYGFRDV